MSTTDDILAERVYQVLTGDVMRNRSDVPGYQGTLSAFESDIGDWGVVYGLAYGIALAESESLTDVERLADRARDAAVAAYMRWGAVSRRCDERHLMEELIHAYDSWDQRGDLPVRLSDALIDLRNNIGVADTEPVAL